MTFFRRLITKLDHWHCIQNKFLKIMMVFMVWEHLYQGALHSRFSFVSCHLKMEIESVSTEKINTVVMIYTSICGVLGSNLDQDTSWGFHGFPLSLHANTCIVLWFGDKLFLPNLFQFLIHQCVIWCYIAYILSGF